MFVLGHSKGDIWWLKLLGGPLPNQPSVVAALEKLSYSAAGRDDVPQQATTIYHHQHRTSAITRRTNPPPAFPIMATCHAASARKHFTRNRVQKSIFLFFSKSTEKRGAYPSENCQMQELKLNITWAGLFYIYFMSLAIFRNTVTNIF